MVYEEGVFLHSDHSSSFPLLLRSYNRKLYFFNLELT